MIEYKNVQGSKENSTQLFVFLVFFSIYTNPMCVYSTAKALII